MTNKQFKTVRKKITDLPSVPGTYNIEIRGIFTFAPIFADFDGKEWINLDIWGKSLDDVSYYDKIPAPEETITVTKHLSDLPLKAGVYNIVIEEVDTMLPIFGTFDGEKWTDLNLKQTDEYPENMYYIDTIPAYLAKKPKI